MNDSIQTRDTTGLTIGDLKDLTHTELRQLLSILTRLAKEALDRVALAKEKEA